MIDFMELPPDIDQGAAAELTPIDSVDNLVEQLQEQHPKAPATPANLAKWRTVAKAMQQQQAELRKAELQLRAPVRSKADLIQRLKAEARLYKAEHTKINDTTGNVTTPRIPPRAVADILLNNIKFVIIGKDNKENAYKAPYFYDIDQGIYVSLQRELERLCLLVERELNIKGRKETIEYIRLEAPTVEPTENPALIVCNNGIYNKATKQLEPFNDQYKFISKIATNLNLDASEPDFNGWKLSEWIKELSDGDQSKEKLIWQLIASTVNANYVQPYAFFLVDNGQGRTGKSTFETLLKNLVGKANYSSLMLVEFEHDFKLATAMGRALIIGDDNNPKDYNENSANFKSMVTGDVVLINPKGLPPYTDQSTATIVQSMNSLPKFKDATGGTLRRLKIIRFNHQYPDTPAGRKIKDEYIKDTSLLEWVLKKAVTIDIERLEDTEESRGEVREIKQQSDPIAYFMQEYFPELTSERIPTAFLFKYFLAVMAYENNPSRITQRGFTERLKENLPEGWKYERNRKYVGNWWDDRDMDVLNLYDRKNVYPYEPKPRRAYQGLIYKKY